MTVENPASKLKSSRQSRQALSKRDTCRLCGSRNLDSALPLLPTVIADAYVSKEQLNDSQETYPLELFLCRGCGHVQMLHVVDPKVLFQNYNYFTSSSPWLVEHFRKLADELLSLVIPPQGALVVDIGSNDGSLLAPFKNRGMRVLGIDPAQNVAQLANERGLETLAAFFASGLAQDVRRQYGPASIVTANNVFAHVDHLEDIAEGIRFLLAPEGIFVFEVSYLVDLIQKNLIDTIYHEHLCYHSVKPLEAFFRRHGLELIDVKRNPSKGGSIRGMVQLAGGPRPVDPSVAELIQLEMNLGMDRPEVFKLFASTLESFRVQFRRSFQSLKKRGKTIAGYGASTPVTTLIYQFEMGEALDFIVDDNPQKQNLFSPGFHIPILPSPALYERKPGYVVVLAWNYFQPILEKHEAFVKQGGHFIVPLPVPMVF